MADLHIIADNPYFSAGAGLIGIGTGLALLRQSFSHLHNFLRRRLLVTMEIPSKDPAYAWFLQWMSKNTHNFRTPFLSVNTLVVKKDTGSTKTLFELAPGCGKHYFKWKGAWMQVERQRDSKLMDLTQGTPWETVTLTTLSTQRDRFLQLLEESKKLALSSQEGKTVIYKSVGHEWRPFGHPRRKRPLDSVVLDQCISDSIKTDVQEFIQNGQWYYDRGIPYRRGYLLYGPPGSGKTSFIQALAGALDYNICILNLSERGLTDDRLHHLLSVAPHQSFILLEDIDAAFAGRKQQEEKFASLVTFSGLLNSLDGVASSEERIVFMTTNHFERLDPALIRPGRVDVKKFVGDATPYQIEKLFSRFYGDERGGRRMVEAIRGKSVSMAQLQGHFVMHKNNAEEAIQKIEN